MYACLFGNSRPSFMTLIYCELQIIVTLRAGLIWSRERARGEEDTSPVDQLP